MTREAELSHRIAILATGDEISNGDILNTNSQEIANQLFKHGMHVGLHMVSTDRIADIETAINFLLSNHDALIITGGLGPTSDDLTRYALSKAINTPLIFSESAWKDIVDLLTRYGYHNPPESNRQQALFPEGATLIPNPNGTAAGCIVEHNHQLIFMLPGPPPECLHMFREAIIPKLKQANFAQVEFHKNWLVFGVSEGQIAEKLDALATPYECLTGYRLAYPYIELKLHSNHAQNFAELIPQVEQTIAPYLIGDGTRTASEMLRTHFETTQKPILICDLATGGSLESTIKTPKTRHSLQFTYDANANSDVLIKGLDDYWQETGATKTMLEVHFTRNKKEEILRVEIPFRGHRVKLYAVEFVCWKLLTFLAT